METFLRKYFFTVNLAAIVVCGVLIGKATNRSLEPKLFGRGGSSGGDDHDGPSSSGRPGSGRGISGMPTAISGPGLSGGMLRKDGREVLKHNVFCSLCPPYDGIELKPHDIKDDSNAVPRSSLRLQLVSTVTSDTDPAWAFAAVRDMGNSSIGLYRVKSQLTDGATVETIEAARILIRNAGKLEFLDLKEGDKGPVVAAGGDGKTGIAGLSAADLAKGVRKLGDNKYEVDRELINKLLGNTGALASTARIVPSSKDGKPDGFRVYGIRPGSLWGAIGVENGDTIRAINGLEMTTPDKALEVYTKIKNAAHLSISLSRRNTPQTMDYTIR